MTGVLMAKRLLGAAVLSAALVWMPLEAPADPITDLGSIYTLTLIGLQSQTTTTDTWRIHLSIDTTNYEFDNEFLAAVSIQAWGGGDFVSFSLFSAPGGIEDWIEAQGPANAASGCADNNDMACVLHVDATTDGSLDGFPALGGLTVPYGTYDWDFDVTLSTGSLLQGTNQAHVQALYLRAGSQEGQIHARLTSEDITLQNGTTNGEQVAVPATLLLVGSALLGVGAVRGLKRRLRR